MGNPFLHAASLPPLVALELATFKDTADDLIGLQPEAEYGCESLVLEPGDVLLYYTDGVTEAPGITGDRFVTFVLKKRKAIDQLLDGVMEGWRLTRLFEI